MSKTKTERDAAHDVEFVEVLVRQGRGSTNEELSEALRELTKRVVATGKPGTINLTVNVSQIKKTGQLIISDKIRTKLPEYDRPVTIAFADEAGNLLREDPNQRPLWGGIEDLEDKPVAVVNLGGEVTVVDPTTGEIKE